VQTALLNLAINACDAMPDGGKLTFKTEAVDIAEGELRDTPTGKQLPVGRYLKVSVADTGQGISTGIISRIFEPFFTTKKVGKGTGLGLASVYGCVESHNGYVKVDSVVGEGAVFSLFFPLSSPLVIV
jgi:signal transduction histidine kinase